VGVSKNHLVRLFHQSFDMTVVEYIRRRRAEMAWEMLVNSSMPIKAIAHYVGIPDVQHFYKTMKREYGLTPGDIRKGEVPELSKTVEK
jgi:two-component system response regulator YesN